MLPSYPSDKELLKSILEPLLEDFSYWFEQSRTFLETETIFFLEREEQDILLDRINRAQQEVMTAKMLLSVTEGQAGIDPAILAPWHKLVTECWLIAQRCRSNQPPLHP